MKKTCVTERKFFTVINLLSVLNKDGYKYKKAINNIINSNTNDRKIDLDSIRSKDNGIDNYLKDFLHCEQIILLHILNNTSLFREVLEENIKNIPDVKKIKKITLDIITYIDMCPNCFATCEFFFNDLKNTILSNLFPEHSADDIPFQIIISSLQPYKIARTNKFTRCSRNNNTWFDVFYAKPSHHTEDIEGKIIQFANPWLMELAFRDIFEKLQTSINKALSLEDLNALYIKIKALKNINIDDDIKSNYNFQELHNNFCKKYLSLFENYLSCLKISNVNLISQISSYAPELLDVSKNLLRDALNQILNQTESIQGEQQEEFEHNNNKKD